jgi:hypothetical protein
LITRQKTSTADAQFLGFARMRVHRVVAQRAHRAPAGAQHNAACVLLRGAASALGIGFATPCSPREGRLTAAHCKSAEGVQWPRC